MGADIVEEGRASHGGEPVADLVVRHAPLRGIEVPVELVPDMIDEFPILAIAAACARGTTVVRGAAELRVKESRSEEPTSELQSLMRISYAVFCLKKTNRLTVDTQKRN